MQIKILINYLLSNQSIKMQKLTLVGNLGADAVIRQSAGKEDFMSLKIACTESSKDRDGNKTERTTWYDCTSKKTNLAQFLLKGHQVLIEGNPKYDIYQDRAGEPQIQISVSIRDITLLKNKKD